jgi:hypothetical protein
MEYPDLTEMERRSKRYWNVDGIPEMVMGIVWIVWGAGFLVQNAIPKGSRFSSLESWILPIALVGSGFAASWIIKILKNKYTFPRGGYVKFNAPPRSQRILTAVVAGLAAAVFAALFAFAASGRFDANVFGPIIGLIMAVGFLFGSRQPGLRHFVWFSLISLVFGAALYPLKLGWLALPWFFIVMGVPFIVAGVCRLRAYVRSVPLQGGDES